MVCGFRQVLRGVRGPLVQASAERGAWSFSLGKCVEGQVVRHYLQVHRG